jgi:hypothetical protein
VGTVGEVALALVTGAPSAVTHPDEGVPASSPASLGCDTAVRTVVALACFIRRATRAGPSARESRKGRAETVAHSSVTNRRSRSSTAICSGV